MSKCSKRQVRFSPSGDSSKRFAGQVAKLDLCTVHQGGKTSYSFLAQSLGLMADLDFGGHKCVLR